MYAPTLALELIELCTLERALGCLAYFAFTYYCPHFKKCFFKEPGNAHETGFVKSLTFYYLTFPGDWL